jgi:hypothetical protein
VAGGAWSLGEGGVWRLEAPGWPRLVFGPGPTLSAVPLDGVGAPGPAVPLLRVGLGSGAAARVLATEAGPYRAEPTGDAWTAGLVGEVDGLRVRVRLAAVPDLRVLVASASLEALEASVTIRSPSLRFGVASAGAGPLALHWVDGVRLEEQHAFPVSFLRRTTPLGPGGRQALRATGGGRPTSSNRFLPWFALLDENGRGVWAEARWSGAWTWEVARQGELATCAFGVDPLVTVLQPGDRLELPEVFWGLSEGGLDGAAQAAHRYLRATAPAWPGGPWVQVNSWYAWGNDLREAELLREVEVAAQLGAEVFVLDDGWFEGAVPGRPWGSGAGLWREDRRKFPGGLRAFGERVRAAGLAFGAWVEPERVDLNVLEAAGVDRRWLARRQGQEVLDPRLPSAQVCFGCPEALAWAERWLAELVEGLGLDWLKWDHNLYQICDRPDHGHGPGDGNWAHVQGVYRVLDGLRRRFPRLIVENCASGGSRLDAGLHARTHLTWLSDLPAPSQRARSQFAGAVCAFPPEHLNAWVVPDPAEPLTPDSVPYAFRSRFLGAFGVSDRLAAWDDALVRAAAAEVALYKRWRALLVRARVHLLLPQETSAEAWWAVQLVDEGAEEAAVLVFRHESPEAVRQLPLRGLRGEAVYEVADLDAGTTARRTGASLMGEGVAVRLDRPRSSRCLWLRAAAP